MTAQLLPDSPFASSQPSTPGSLPVSSHLTQALAAGSGSLLPPAVSSVQQLGLANAHALCGQASLPGCRYGLLNQDWVISAQLHDAKQLKQQSWAQCYVSVVLDGHGMLGESAAREAGAHILHILKHSGLRHRQLADFSEQEVRELMRQAFLAGHQAALSVYHDPPLTYLFPQGSRQEQRYMLKTNGNGDKARIAGTMDVLDVYCSSQAGGRMLEFGTTATVALMQGTTLVIASVGDSLAVLGREEGDGYEAEIVSVRHWGFNLDEQQRLRRECGDAVSVSPEDGYLTVEEGRLQGFQLAMTRALGHRLLAQYGVSWEPSVTVFQLRPEHICLIVATDGVWEVISPGAAVKLAADVIAEGHTADEAARQLCDTAVRLANGCVRQPGEADNTSAAMYVFAEL